MMKESSIAKMCLALVITVAALLRLIGTYPGYPPYHSDEGISYSAAVSMIKAGNLDPLRYDYPAIVPLVNYISFRGFFIPISWGKYYVQNFGKIMDGFIKIPLSPTDYSRIYQLEILGSREMNSLIWGRITTAIIGIGVVMLTFLLGRAMFGTKIAIIATLFVAVNYRLVLNSHFGLPDTYNSFFLLASCLATWNLNKSQTPRNYFIAGLLAGISLATKYQPFGIICLLFVHLSLAYKEQTLKAKIRHLFRLEAFLLLFVIIGTFILVNPYAFIKIEETIDWLKYVSSKYRPGRYEVDVYSLSYLYHLALGPILAISFFLGLLINFFRKRKETIFLLSIIVPFFYVTIYYSGAGFYTRNFVTIIPFVLIFSAVGISALISIYKVRIVWLLTIAVALLISRDQIRLSQVVATEYSKQWNYEVLNSWLNKNISKQHAVSAHSSVPLPAEIQRLPFDYHLDFSISEFKESGADFAIANLDWVTNDFYWWMTQSFKDGWKYWNKPVGTLEETFPAMTIREMSDYAVYQVTNHWAAPDSDFIVANVPVITAKKGTLNRRFSFEDLEGWHKAGGMGTSDDNLVFQDGQLKILMASAKSPVLRWESEPISIDGWNGTVIESRVKSKNSRMKEGFLFAKYYANELDALNNKNRVAVRLSKRNKNDDKWNLIGIISKIPANAKYMTIGLQVYDSSLGEVSLDEVSIYQSTVTEDSNGWEIKPIYLEPDLLFPSSHGYL